MSYNQVSPGRAQDSADETYTCKFGLKGLLVVIFFEINIFKPLAIAWLAALSVAGGKDILGLLLLYITLGVYGFLSAISFTAYLLIKKIPYSFWTAAVISEACKERKLDKFLNAGFILLYWALALQDWHSCQQDPTSDCSTIKSQDQVIIASIIVLISAIGVIAYNGPYSERLKLKANIFEKIKFYSLWMDSASFINSLREMALVARDKGYEGVEQLKNIAEYDDLPWSMISDFGREELMELHSIFCDSKEKSNEHRTPTTIFGDME